MEKKTQQREGHASTRSLPHHRVTPQSDRSLEKKQDPSEQGFTRILQIFDQLKPHILWVIVVLLAVYDFFHPSDLVGLMGFLALIAAAAGSISLPQAINFLSKFYFRGRSMPLLDEEESKSGEDQNETV